MMTSCVCARARGSEATGGRACLEQAFRDSRMCQRGVQGGSGTCWQCRLESKRRTRCGTHATDTEIVQKASRCQRWMEIVGTGGIAFLRSCCWRSAAHDRVTHPMIDPTVHVRPYKAKASVEFDSSVISPYIVSSDIARKALTMEALITATLPFNAPEMALARIIIQNRVDRPLTCQRSPRM